MAYKTFADIPNDVLGSLITLIQKDFRMPTAPGDVAAMNFAAGQCSVVERFVIERDKRTKTSEREAENKNG